MPPFTYCTEYYYMMFACIKSNLNKRIGKSIRVFTILQPMISAQISRIVQALIASGGVYT